MTCRGAPRKSRSALNVPFLFFSPPALSDGSRNEEVNWRRLSSGFDFSLFFLLLLLLKRKCDEGQRSLALTGGKTLPSQRAYVMAGTEPV